jgi:hypothetical protein
MTVKLNRRGFEFATSLVRKGKLVLDERDDWSEHRPAAKQENESIERHGYGEYSMREALRAEG